MITCRGIRRVLFCVDQIFVGMRDAGVKAKRSLYRGRFE